MIGCVPKLNDLSNLAPTGKMTVSSTFRHNPFFYVSAIVLFRVRNTLLHIRLMGLYILT